MDKKYLILAYYHFLQIDDPQREVSLHKEFFQQRDLTSRIYISDNGINGQMSAKDTDAHEYMQSIAAVLNSDRSILKSSTIMKTSFQDKQ